MVFIQSKFSYLLASAMAAAASIGIERRGRRSEIAVFVCNHASEVIYRMLVARGKQFLNYVCHT
jgi:hypothetical protein